jgi:hypothetical protein
MKKTLAYILFSTSLVTGRAIADPMDSNPIDAVFYKASHKAVVHATEVDVQSVYGREFGFASVTNRVVKDVEGREFLYVNMKGDGDCCFHGLGISREEMLNRLEAYIRANEASFRDVSEGRLSEYNKISSYLAGYKEMVERKEVAEFKKADFLDKEAGMKEYVDDHLAGDQGALKDLITVSWEVLINAQLEVDTIDWDVILVQIYELVTAFHSANAELIRVKTYREFLQSCEADFWKEVGSNTLLRRIEEFMRRTDHKTLKDGAGKPLKLMNLIGDLTIDDITPYLEDLNKYLDMQVSIGLRGRGAHKLGKDFKKLQRQKKISTERASKKLAAASVGSGPKTAAAPEPFKLSAAQVESINAKLQFSKASLENKVKLLRRFYGTYASGGRRVWLDSSAIAPIADQLGLKVKVYKLEQDKQLRFTGRYYVVASSPNADEKDGPELRRIYHMGGHYDMLVPVIGSF